MAEVIKAKDDRDETTQLFLHFKKLSVSSETFLEKEKVSKFART